MKEKLESLYLETHVKIHTVLLLGGLILTGIGGKISEFGRLHVIAWIGILIIALGMLWRFLFIKCPIAAANCTASGNFRNTVRTAEKKRNGLPRRFRSSQ